MNRFKSSIFPWLGVIILLVAFGVSWQIAAWKVVAHERALAGAIGNPEPLNDRIFHYGEGGSRIERHVFVIPVGVTLAGILLVLLVVTVVFVRRAPLKVAGTWLAAIALAGAYFAANLYMYALATNTFI